MLYRDRATSLVERINGLKEARHDIVHGLAERKAKEGLSKIVRHDYKGKELVEQSKNYSLDQVISINEDIVGLAKDMVVFLKETVGSSQLENLFEKTKTDSQ